MSTAALWCFVVVLLCSNAVAVAVVIRLYKLLMTDDLTGASSRRGLMAYVNRLVKKAGAFSVDNHAVVVIDINRFKAINDTHGHRAGDEILRDVARRLKVLARLNRKPGRQLDCVARIGGDEFIVILAHCRLDAVAGRCAQIQEALRNTCNVGDMEIPYSCSVGFAPYRTDQAWQEAVDTADRAMYTAKKDVSPLRSVGG